MRAVELAGAPSLARPGHAARAEGRRETRRREDGALGSNPLRRALARALILLQRSGVLWRFNFTVTGRLCGRSVAIPLIKGEGLQLIHGDEPWMIPLLDRLMSRQSGAFVDVGANLGQTLMKVRAIDPQRPYVGFEPNPAASSYCRELVRVNRYGNATICPIGLSTASGVVLLFSKADTDPSASIVADFRRRERYSDAQPVSVHAGDDVLPALGLERIGIVKIDVEGGELDVIRGLAATVRAHRPVILCEVLPVYDPSTAEGTARRRRQDQLHDLLQAERYSIFRIDDGALTMIDGFGVHGDIRLSNYAFIPAEAEALAPALSVK